MFSSAAGLAISELLSKFIYVDDDGKLLLYKIGQGWTSFSGEQVFNDQSKTPGEFWVANNNFYYVDKEKNIRVIKPENNKIL